MPSEPVRRRRCTPVVVGPPRTAQITPDDYELAVHTIAAMIARWWDANDWHLLADENDSVAPKA